MLRRKHNRRSPVRMRLADILRRIAWPIGERRELEMWRRGCRYLPHVASLTIALLLGSWLAMPVDVWMHVFVSPGSEAERVAHDALCGLHEVQWHTCPPARVLPLTLAGCFVFPLVGGMFSY